MASERAEIVAGAAFLTIATRFSAHAANATGFAKGDSSYPLKAVVRSVDGSAVGSDVRLAGLKIGTVAAGELTPQRFFADTTIRIRRDIQVPDDSAILISSEGLLGGNFVDIQPCGSAAVLAPDKELENTQGSVSLVTLLLKFVGSTPSTDAELAP